jgi:hypothetical protein
LKQQCAKLHVFECLEKHHFAVTAAAAVSRALRFQTHKSNSIKPMLKMVFCKKNKRFSFKIIKIIAAAMCKIARF